MIASELPYHRPAASTGDRVVVRAPGRLHLGFLDPSASLGRAFGSVGVVIEGFETVVTFESAPRDAFIAEGAAAEAELGRARVHLQRLRDHSGCHAPLRLRLQQVLPAHAGFGSGTQLALAIGRAFAAWHRLELPTETLAQWLGRGARSGIGIAGFDQGGLLLDGGPGASGTPAPVLARVALPEAWRIVVVQDHAVLGLSGEAEKRAIAALPSLPRAAAADLCHQVLMRVLPGAASAEFVPFAAGLNQLQQVLGEHFAPAQGGRRYASDAVQSLLEWMGRAGLGCAPGSHDAGAAIGQSSWGPTGFAIVASQARAQALVDAADAAGVIAPELTLSIVRASPRGASLIDTRGP